LPFLSPPSVNLRFDRRGGTGWKRWLLAGLGIALLVLLPWIARAQGVDSVTVAWTAPGDDDRFGTATAYDVRVSDAPIDAGSFAAARHIDGAPAPASAGTKQHFVIRGLDRDTVYYIALRTVDDAGNWSNVSNLVRWDWIVDHAPPSPPQHPGGQKQGESVVVSWPPSSESDLQGYNVYRSSSSNGSYVQINTQLVLTNQFVDAHPPTNSSAAWYEVTAVDASGNESARSASISVALSASATDWALDAAYPNPSRAPSVVQIPVSVPVTASGELVIDIFDSGNRLVRRVHAAASPGPQRVQWDGKNDAGIDVAPGVYRACLESAGSKVSIRLLRVP
jgi:hypothetical protein